MSQVRELLESLAAGNVTLAAVAADFITRQWTPERTPSSDYDTEVHHELVDEVAVMPKNSWLEVESAYVSGLISESEYEALYSAVTVGRTRP